MKARPRPASDPIPDVLSRKEQNARRVIQMSIPFQTIGPLFDRAPLAVILSVEIVELAAHPSIAFELLTMTAPKIPILRLMSDSVARNIPDKRRLTYVIS
jgi:hypothetical protein